MIVDKFCVVQTMLANLVSSDVICMVICNVQNTGGMNQLTGRKQMNSERPVWVRT